MAHSFNPLKGITYTQARILADVLYTAYPQGENTLTVRNGRRELLQAMLTTTSFKKITGSQEITDMIQDILVSPVLYNVFCGSKRTFSFKDNGAIFARINRAELGDFDALILGLVLMSFYKGQLIVPDFGFYGREAHSNLIRQDRLLAGVRYLDELPLRLKRHVLLIKDIEAHGVLYEDAITLAAYRGLTPHTMGYQAFVDDALAG